MNLNDTITWFQNMKPFKDETDIPNLPNVPPSAWEMHIVPNLIRCGAIPKDKLKIGQWYVGDTRNARYAMWNGKVFVYERCKWGSYFKDEVNHFEDDDGYALFVPLKEINPPQDLHCEFLENIFN